MSGETSTSVQQDADTAPGKSHNYTNYLQITQAPLFDWPCVIHLCGHRAWKVKGQCKIKVSQRISDSCEKDLVLTRATILVC